MSDPNYIIYWASAQELIFNGRTDLGQVYLTASVESMDNMRINNIVMPNYASQEVEDVDSIRDNAAFGV
jgi:hypothetical protein